MVSPYRTGLLAPPSSGLGLGATDPNAAYQMPRVPWSQNPLITTAALGLLGGRTLNEGLQNVAQIAPAGLAAKTAMQRDMYTIGQENARKAQMNEALKNWPGLSDAQKAMFTNQPELFGQYAVSTMTPAKPTDDISEYNYARQQGFKGNFQDWQTTMKQAGAQRSVGPPQPGWKIVYDAAGNPVSQEPIPGGPADLERKAEETATTSKTEQQAVKAGTILDATKSVKEEIAGAWMPAVGTNSKPFALHSDTAAGRVRSYVSTLKSGVALQSLLKLKEQSSTGASGFGALSGPELQLLVDDIGSLDPDNTPEDVFLKTIDRIEARWKSILADVQRTVPPERLKEIGVDIEALTGGGSDTSATTPVPASDYFK